MEGKLPVGDRPFIWQIKKFPLTAAFFAAMVVSVFLFPFSLTASTVSSAFTSATFAEVNTSIAAIAAAIIFRTCLPIGLFLFFSVILFSFHTFPSFLPNTIFFPINRFAQPVLLVSTYVKIIRDISLPVNVCQHPPTEYP